MLIRWFLASVDLIEKFFEINFKRERFAQGANLCAVGQISLIGMLLVAAHVAVAMFGVWWVVVRPAMDYGWFAFFVVGAVATLAAVFIWSCKLVGDWKKRREEEGRRRWREERAKRWQMGDDSLPEPQKPVPMGPSFFDLAWTWMVAIKQRMCPIISWTEPVPMERSMFSKLPIHWGHMLVLILALFVAALAMNLLPLWAVTLKANWSVAGEMQCSMIGAEPISGIQINLKCGNTRALSHSRELAVYFLNHPSVKTVTCTVYEDGDAGCFLP
jgi:hypothetical protein